MGRVLLVDDEAMVLDVMSIMLGDAGIEHVAVSSFASAMEVFSAERPDVLVTDVLLKPLDRDGVALAKLARTHWPGLPVIFVSGYTPDLLVVYRRENPGTAFLAKPFESDDLITAVRSALSRR